MLAIESIRKKPSKNAENLASLLAGAWRSSPPDTEVSPPQISELLPQLFDSGSAALAWWRIRLCDSLDSRIARQLQEAYRYSTINGDLFQHEIKQAFRLLRSVGVEPILVKGWAAARLYAEPGLRPSGDIDLCVHPAQYAVAETALNEWTDHEFALDLHEGFSTLDHENVDVVCSRSQLIKLGDVDIRVLAPEDHLRVLCTHFLRHGAFRPVWLCDIAAAVEARADSFDWELCLSKDRRRREWVGCCVRLADQMLAAKVYDTPFGHNSEKLPSWLIPSVLKQWERPNTFNHGVMKHRKAMVNYLRKPAGIFEDIRNRWPNPIEATVYTGGPFNELPRWPFQVGECVARTAKFLAGLPKALREGRERD